MSVSTFSDAELVALMRRCGGSDLDIGDEQKLGTAILALGMANRSAASLMYGDAVERPNLAGADEALVLRMLDSRLGQTATEQARSLLYNCITNAGTDFAPANYRDALLQAAADADAAAAARPGLDRDDKVIVAAARFGGPAAGTVVSILEMAESIAAKATQQPEKLPYITRDECVKSIRASLKARSKTPWSVKCDTGTAWGWITITAAPRVNPNGWMTDAQCAELATLLGLERVFKQGHTIAAANDYYIEAMDRAAGKPPRTFGTQYWD